MTQSTRATVAAAHLQPRIEPSTVVGWGVDADPENDPTWPMRDRSHDDGEGLDWIRPELQTGDVEILQSVEHLRRTAAFGTSTPPSGISGEIRRQAFALSESQWGHWLLLMLADRVNAVEGLLDDVRRGIVPNPLVETGLVPQRRSREAAGATIVFAALSVTAAVWLMRRRR